MSRSYRKSPFMGLCSDSDKIGKRLANRACRHAQNIAVKRGDEVVPVVREVYNVYDFPKDGKQMIDKKSKWMRK